ncbi:MAG: hypothetical protein Tsb0019_25130 [Roseibium sp.]
MADDTPKKGLKSVAGKTPLRSRGFLSQPGGLSAPSGKTGDQAATPEHHRSRGSRQVSATADRRPRDLAVKPAIRPYTLEDE